MARKTDRFPIGLWYCVGTSATVRVLIGSHMHYKLPPTSADEIAEYFLTLGRRDEIEIDPLKLQKLLYYAQSWHLAELGELLFKEKIEAWPVGPVVATVYRQYKVFGSKAIDTTGIKQPPLTEEEAELLESVWCRYGKLSGPKLAGMSHHEDPWIKARGNLPLAKPSNKEVKPEVMRQYFCERMRKANEDLAGLLPIIARMAK